MIVDVGKGRWNGMQREGCLGDGRLICMGWNEKHKVTSGETQQSSGILHVRYPRLCPLIVMV
jgi:hypothetical protein